MRFVAISKFILIALFPLFLTLAILNFVAFDKSFYEEKFSEYLVEKSIKDPLLLHERVINFIRGDSNDLPDAFNEREKDHLVDVRKLVVILSIILYMIIVAFAFFLIATGIILKVKSNITNYFGKIMLFGGLLTIFLSIVFFIFISANFQATFESFHRIFFEQGTYLFDPRSENIVKLYPQEIFMDIGLRLSKLVLVISSIFVLAGFYLIFRSRK